MKVTGLGTHSYAANLAVAERETLRDLCEKAGRPAPERISPLDVVVFAARTGADATLLQQSPLRELLAGVFDEARTTMTRSERDHIVLAVNRLLSARGDLVAKFLGEAFARRSMARPLHLGRVGSTVAAELSVLAAEAPEQRVVVLKIHYHLADEPHLTASGRHALDGLRFEIVEDGRPQSLAPSRLEDSATKGSRSFVFSLLGCPFTEHPDPTRFRLAFNRLSSPHPDLLG